jgi:hypothetical protein
MGHIRGHGCPSLVVYCVSPWCNHGATLTLDWLPDDTVLLDLDPSPVTRCGPWSRQLRATQIAALVRGGFLSAEDCNDPMALQWALSELVERALGDPE